MYVRDREAYEYWKQSQLGDGYPIRLVINMMEKWANSMESYFPKKARVKHIAEKSAKEIGLLDLDSLIIDATVRYLVIYWNYGEELRIFWNSRLGYSGDGLVLHSKSTKEGGLVVEGF